MLSIVALKLHRHGDWDKVKGVRAQGTGITMIM